MAKLGDTRPALEDCTLDILDDYNAMILPNSVQLVESELPLSEADNCAKLSGVFLFRQIFPPYDGTLQCLLCRNKYSTRYPADLKKHYHGIHELTVNTSQAKFNENIVFVCVPSDVDEETTLNSLCRFCDTTLRTLAEVRDHYPNAHNKAVRLLPESQVDEIGNFFYCSLCGHPSEDFSSHHQHMKVMHRMQTGMHGEDRLTKHIMLSHAVETGPKTWSCAMCLYQFGDTHELMTHIPTCTKLQSSSESKTSDNSAAIFKILSPNGDRDMLRIPVPANAESIVLKVPQGYTLVRDDSANGKYYFGPNSSIMSLDESGEP